MKTNPAVYYYRHLPHYQPADGIFFVTFRLAGTLPREVLKRLQAERDLAVSIESRLQKKLRNESRAHFFEAYAKPLDQQFCSPFWLSRPRLADVVHEAIRYRDRKEYWLFASCVMPNHVHLLFATGQVGHCPEKPLFRILQSLKRHTAREANKILNRSGKFWQGESYDHVVRDEKELERLVWYVLFNPVKAGLVSSWDDWRWSYVDPEIMKR